MRLRLELFKPGKKEKFPEVRDVLSGLAGEISTDYDGKDYTAKTPLISYNITLNEIRLSELIFAYEVPWTSSIITPNNESAFVEGYYGNQSYAIEIGPKQLSITVPETMDLDGVKNVVNVANAYIQEVTERNYQHKLPEELSTFSNFT